jgi:polypeptide N-acetylgalactosaminyltransferase
MKQPLDDYCEEHFGDIVKILRAPKRLGLIAAKNYGGRHATGDVVVFLDAHIEASPGWLLQFNKCQNKTKNVHSIIL